MSDVILITTYMIRMPTMCIKCQQCLRSNGKELQIDKKPTLYRMTKSIKKIYKFKNPSTRNIKVYGTES